MQPVFSDQNRLVNLAPAGATLVALLSTSVQWTAVTNMFRLELLMEALEGVEATFFLVSMSEPVTKKSLILSRASWGVRY